MGTGAEMGSPAMLASGPVQMGLKTFMSYHIGCLDTNYKY